MQILICFCKYVVSVLATESCSSYRSPACGWRKGFHLRQFG